MLSVLYSLTLATAMPPLCTKAHSALICGYTTLSGSRDVGLRRVLLLSLGGGQSGPLEDTRLLDGEEREIYVGNEQVDVVATRSRYVYNAARLDEWSRGYRTALEDRTFRCCQPWPISQH